MEVVCLQDSRVAGTPYHYMIDVLFCNFSHDLGVTTFGHDLELLLDSDLRVMLIEKKIEMLHVLALCINGQIGKWELLVTSSC